MSFMRHFLWPFALVYGFVIRIRHVLFDWGVLRSKRGAIKAIVLGNVALGGTGKTPHAASLIQLLDAAHKGAFLSRGYGRKTKGVLKITSDATADQVGDEPLLIARRFPNLPCYVGEDRVAAIAQIARETEARFVVLDDALQHRRLRPDVSIMLTTWNNPYDSDHFLPVGSLRDWSGRVNKADALIITKCPQPLDSTQRSEWISRLALDQKPIFFTGLTYGAPLAVRTSEPLLAGDAVVVVSAIADASLFVRHVRASYRVLAHFDYADHAPFSQQEIDRWQAKKSGQYLNVLTTEKDVMRLLTLSWPDTLRVYYIPIEVVFIGEGEQDRFVNFIQNKLEH